MDNDRILNVRQLRLGLALKSHIHLVVFLFIGALGRNEHVSYFAPMLY